MKITSALINGRETKLGECFIVTGDNGRGDKSWQSCDPSKQRVWRIDAINCDGTVTINGCQPECVTDVKINLSEWRVAFVPTPMPPLPERPSPTTLVVGDQVKFLSHRFYSDGSLQGGRVYEVIDTKNHPAVVFRCVESPQEKFWLDTDFRRTIDVDEWNFKAVKLSPQFAAGPRPLGY